MLFDNDFFAGGVPILSWGRRSGDLVVCLHGLGDRKEAYRLLGPLLAGHGYRVVAPDGPGHGASKSPSPRLSSDLMAETALVLEGLGGGAILVAHSAAAVPAMALAVLRPDLVRGLVLLAPFVGPEPSKRFLRLVSQLVMRTPLLWGYYYASMFSSDRPADLKDHIKSVKRGLRSRGVSTLGYYKGRGDLLVHAAGLSGRHLALLGDRDPSGVTMESLTTELTSIAPHAQWKVSSVVNSGHCSHQDSAAVVAKMIRSFHAPAQGENHGPSHSIATSEGGS